MISWVYRKVFGESLGDRQRRKLGEIDTERAILHNVEDRPILNRDVQKEMVFPPKKKKKRRR